MTLPILFLLAIAICIIVVILFVRSERRKDRAYALALLSRRQPDCASLHIDDAMEEFVAIANKAAEERLNWYDKIYQIGRPVDSDSIPSCDSSPDCGSSSSD